MHNEPLRGEPNQKRSLTVMDGVKTGVGMFIVLPLIIIFGGLGLFLVMGFIALVLR